MTHGMTASDGGSPGSQTAKFSAKQHTVLSYTVTVVVLAVVRRRVLKNLRHLASQLVPLISYSNQKMSVAILDVATSKTDTSGSYVTIWLSGDRLRF